MFEGFAEEISSSLESGGLSTCGAAPTILIGLGRFGTDCIRSVAGSRELDSRVAALSIRSDARVERGVAFVSENGWPAALTSAGGPGDAGRDNAVSPWPEISDWLRKTAADLVSPVESGEHLGRIQVFVMGGAEEPDVSALARPVAECVKKSVGALISNWLVTQNGFFLLPKGESPRGASVYALLDDLTAAATGMQGGIGGPAAFDRVFLVSEANAGGLLVRDEAIDLFAEFTDLMLESEFSGAVNEILDIEGAVFAGFGLASLVHPAKRIVADESARFALELINTGLLIGKDEPFYRLADEYVKSERLNLRVLHDRLISGPGATVLEEAEAEPLAFTNVLPTGWARLINDHDKYLEEQRSPALKARVEENLKEVFGDVRARLRAKVDELMGEESALEKTRNFTGRLAQRVDELENEAFRRGREIAGQAPDLSRYHDELVKRVQNLPGPVATMSRAAMIVIIIYYFTLMFARVLQAFPDNYIDPQYLPSPGVAAIFASAVPPVLAWLIYGRAEKRLFSARESYLRSVKSKHRLALSRDVLLLLSRWLGGQGEQPGVASLKALILEEQASVTKMHKFYLHIGDKIKAEKTEFAESRIRRSALKAFGVDHPWRYKKGRYSLPDEVQQFMVAGHENWRAIEISELSRRLGDYCRRGLTFVGNRSLDNLLIDFSRRGRPVEVVIEDLRRWSSPYIALSTGASRAVELIAISGGNQSFLASMSERLGQAAIVPINSRHRLTFVQLVGVKSVEQLAGYPRWRAA